MNTHYNQPFISDQNLVKDQFAAEADDNPSPLMPNTTQCLENKAQTADYAQYRNSQFALDVNKLKHQNSSIHCQALIATIILFIGEGTGIILHFFTKTDISQAGLIGIYLGSYVLYLIVGLLCNRLGSYLSNLNVGQIFQSSYDRARALIGRFTFHAQCYHYEIRHHTRTVKDSDGNTRHQHYTTTQKVITHVATEYLTPVKTIDESGKVDRIRSNKNIVFIHFFVKYRFANALSSSNFQMIYQSFKIRHNRDVHQEYTMGYSVPGLVDRQAYYVGNLGCSYGAWMYIFAFAGLLWPYSLWVESKIQRFSVQFMKSLTI